MAVAASEEVEILVDLETRVLRDILCSKCGKINVLLSRIF